MQFKKPDARYWDHKFAAYLHDPFDKAFDIRGHEERAAQLMEIFGIDLPNHKYWKKADGIASGFERGQVPSYSKDETKNGAVDFVKDGQAIITHPIGEEAQLNIKLSEKDATKIHETVKQYIKEIIGANPGQGGYSNNFPDQPDRFAMARFFYTHLVLRFKLAEDNVAGLGALWHRLPADTRFPDHSIWQHNALTSALTSCMELAGGEENVGLMVFSITPVQGFIANARKLRDFWSGSVLLSWLAFEGLRWVMENLGPDHVLYPSLIDQPLVNEYLKNEWAIDEKALTGDRDIASLPNKFVILIPLNRANEIGEGIQGAITSGWKALIEKVTETLISNAQLRSPEEIDYLTQMIQDQTDTFWDLHWAAAKLVGEADGEQIAELLPKTAYSNQMGLLKILNKIIADKPYQNSGKGTLYSVSHHLTQSALAAQKMQRFNRRPPQNGEKCSMCGEFEALHSKAHKDKQKAAAYKKHLDGFWKTIRAQLHSDSEIKENEKLCAICYTKRMAYCIIKDKMQTHVLHSTFHDAESFPSTTEIALNDFGSRYKLHKNQLHDLANKIHDMEDEKGLKALLPKDAKLVNSDKYFAILMMDGDRMGKLINGETIAAKWENIMHPEIKQRLSNDDFNPLYKDNWKTIFKKYPKRFITPSIHAAISEALADFAIYGVKHIIEAHNGRLIYAGGDDVCAVLPWQTAIKAAREIQQYYVSNFKIINDGLSKDIELKTPWKIEKGKLAVLLGKGEKISISAGILIAHHKENLSYLIKRAHDLLDKKAKKEADRNALAIELKKRSGGSRFITAKWNDPIWENLQFLQKALGRESQDVSRSLLYRISLYQEGLMQLFDKKYENKSIKFIASLLEKSDSSKESSEIRKMELASAVNKIIKINSNGNQLDTDGLIIAAFLAQKEAK